jgi:hypothetical protein
MVDEDIALLLAIDTAKAIRAKQLSPVEVVQAYLARIERDSMLHAYITVAADAALTADLRPLRSPKQCTNPRRPSPRLAALSLTKGSPDSPARSSSGLKCPSRVPTAYAERDGDDGFRTALRLCWPT